MQDDVQQAIERAKQQLEQMIDLNPEGMLLVDEAGIIRRANASLLHLLKIDGFKNVIGRSVGAVFGGSAEVEELVKTHCSGTARCEADVSLPGVGMKNFRFTVVGGGKDVDLSVVVVSDVSGEKAEAAAQAQAHKKEAVQALVGALMHRINQPLTVIVAHAHLMRLSLGRGGKGGREQLDEGLQTVANQAVEIAGILEHVRHAESYVTEPYVGGLRIFDIERSEGVAPSGSSSAASPVVMKAQSALVELMRALEMRYPGVLVHGERAARCAEILARQMGLDPVPELAACAMAHDIGKIGIPEVILGSAGALSDEDMSLMKRHSDIGGTILEGLQMPAVAEVARSHHERHDGKGYPRGLKGDEVPLAARIVAVVDAFDAMRSGRLYHPSITLDETVRTIQAGSGTQFHPAVVDAFSKCCQELENARSEVKD